MAFHSDFHLAMTHQNRREPLQQFALFISVVVRCERENGSKGHVVAPNKAGVTQFDLIRHITHEPFAT